jgi:hypothetical protein
MIKHIVLLAFKKNLSSQQIQAILNALHELRNVIPEIASFSSGPNQSPEGLNKEYTHAFIMEFNNAAERDIYLNHPEHQRVASEIVIPALEDGINSVIAFDYAE